MDIQPEHKRTRKSGLWVFFNNSFLHTQPEVSLLSGTMKLSITLWTPRDHRQTEALPQFADYLFLNSLGGRKRAEPRPAEDTALTFSTLCVKQVKNNPVKLSPILLTKLLPLQFLFPYRSSLLQLQAIPANSQPQLGKIMKTLINAEDSLSLWPVYTVTL